MQATFSRNANLPALALGITRFHAWARNLASPHVEVSTSRDPFSLLSELPPQRFLDINVMPFDLFSCCPTVTYHVIASCRASSCTPASAGGA